MILLMILSFWSIMMPFSLWIMLILRRFSFVTSWEVYSKRVLNDLTSLSKHILFYVAMRISSVSTARKDLYVL